MFTLFVCASLFGEKVNFELQFPAAPTLEELERRIVRVFGAEHEERMPRGHPRFDFIVARLQVYDDSLLRWVDLVSPRQLHHLDQLYVFQPQSQWHIDVQKDLPPPRAPSGLRHHDGVPSPQRYASPATSRLVAVAAVPYLSGGGDKPHSPSPSREHVSPPRTTVGTTSTTLPALRLELEAARRREAELHSLVAGAAAEVAGIERLVADAEAQEAAAAAAAAAAAKATAGAESPQDAEIRRLREQLARAEAELQRARSASPPTAPKPAELAADVEGLESAARVIVPPPPVREHVIQRSGLFDEFIDFVKDVLPIESEDRPNRRAKQQQQQQQQQQQYQRINAETRPSTKNGNNIAYQQQIQQRPSAAAGFKPSSYVDPNANAGSNVESEGEGSDVEEFEKPDYMRHYHEQTQEAIEVERKQQEWQRLNPDAQRPPPSRKSIYNDSQQLPTDAMGQEVSMAIAPPPTRKWSGAGPSVKGGELKPLFDGGLLYRIIVRDGEDEQWFFYNDTQMYEMHVSYSFGPDSRLQPLDEAAKVERDSDSWIKTEVVVYPSETRGLIVGQINGFRSNLRAEPISQEYQDLQKERAEHVIMEETDAIRALVGSASHGDDEAVVQACVRAGVKYVDPTFPPCDASLSRDGIDPIPIKSCAWKRPTQFLPRELHPFITLYRRIEPNDVDQGALGSCYLLCSIAALAEFPSKIRDIFEHPAGRQARAAEQAVGAYRVTLNKHGWWHTLVLDDYLPVVGDKPCFAKNRNDPTECWAALLEKAYAKLHGSYASISGGDALHALQDLTGYPVNRIEEEEWKAAQRSPADARRLFDLILRFDREKYLINVNTPGQDDSEYMGAAAASNTKEFAAKYKKAGLGLGHAYTVIKARRFPQHGNLELVQIRNPWGSGGGEWSGSWNDNDDRWRQYPDVAEGCEFEPSDDGTFWMEFSEALRWFDGGGACLLKFNWFDYRVRGVFRNSVPSISFEITVTEPTEAFLIFSQTDKRAVPDYEYQALLLTVCRTDTSRPSRGGASTMEVHLHSTNDADVPSAEPTFCYARDRSLHYTFTPEFSPYLVVPRLYDDGVDMDYVLGVISERRAGRGIEVTFKAIDAGCPVLKNYTRFPYSADKTARTVQAEYQFNPEVGAPLSCEGPCLSNV